MSEDRKIFCVRCRERVVPNDLKEAPITWVSKTGKLNQREGYHATCSKCGNKIKQFKKGAAKAAPAPSR